MYLHPNQKIINFLLILLNLLFILQPLQTFGRKLFNDPAFARSVDKLQFRQLFKSINVIEMVELIRGYIIFFHEGDESEMCHFYY
jgi:hypothetical protein